MSARAWLAEALPAEKYPVEKHSFVMELMEKFELAFALEEKEAGQQTDRWLIPELLPENQPHQPSNTLPPQPPKDPQEQRN